MPLGGFGTTKASRQGATPQGPYHCYTCQQLGPYKAALGGYPCGCTACHIRLSLEWARAWVAGTLLLLWGHKGEAQEEHMLVPELRCWVQPLQQLLAKWGLGALGLWLLVVAHVVATTWPSGLGHQGPQLVAMWHVWATGLRRPQGQGCGPRWCTILGEWWWA